MNAMTFKGPQDRIVLTPRRGWQLGLEANLIQKLLGIQAVIDRNAGQQQAAIFAAGDLQAVLADLHDITAGLTLGRDWLLIAEQPNFDVEMGQFAWRNRGKAM